MMYDCGLRVLEEGAGKCWRRVGVAWECRRRGSAGGARRGWECRSGSGLVVLEVLEGAGSAGVGVAW